ncbi:MAG: Asp-tRNA(Asn)/Glu-tRNA(Gln) amidotransferase subunit GatC [Brevinemataceae bacterium]
MLFDPKRIAQLASVELNNNEQESFEQSIDSILNFVETIARLDLDEYKPTIRCYETENAVRNDVVKPGLSLEEIEQNVPKFEDSYIIVPQVIKK